MSDILFKINPVNQKILYSFLCLSLIIRLNTTGLAQTTSILGRFSVDFSRGCNGLTINITENGIFDTPQYWYEGFDENLAGNTDLFRTYSTPGEFYLTQVVNDVLPGGAMDSILITVINPEIPDFIIRNCDNHQVRVEITEDYYDVYRVEFTSTDQENVAPLSLSSTYDYGVQGSYRINVTGLLNNGADNCGTDNAVINTIDDIVDPVLNSIETTVNSAIGDLQLVHTLGDDIIYNLNYAENSSTNLEFEREINGSNSIISGINTRNDYHCYQIQTFNACREENILSDIVCSVNFSVRQEETGNLVEWETDESLPESFNIIRDGELLTNLSDMTNRQYLDTAVICNFHH